MVAFKFAALIEEEKRKKENVYFFNNWLKHFETFFYNEINIIFDILFTQMIC